MTGLPDRVGPIQVALYVIAAFSVGAISAGGLTSWYWTTTTATTRAFIVDGLEDDCREQINQILHKGLQQQIYENDEAARRRDKRQEGVKIITDEPLKFEQGVSK